MNNLPAHSFEVDNATKHGVEIAVIIYHFKYWLNKNVADHKNVHDGRVWTYNSASKFADIFPYFSERKIYRLLQKMEDDGILLSANYNKVGYDRTKWYSLNYPEYCVSDTTEPICQNRKMDLPKVSNGFTESVEPIPDINQVNKPYNYKQFVDLWNEIYGTNLRVTESKEKQIRARLKKFTEDEIKKSMRNRSKDKWLNGDGIQHLKEWSAFWRNDDKVERYLNKGADDEQDAWAAQGFSPVGIL